MNGLTFIKNKQQCWARRKGLELLSGTVGKEGEKNYVRSLEQNLFTPLLQENLVCYEQGDGNETKDGLSRLAKMKALHSSSSLVVNLFQYWQGKDLFPLLNACNFPKYRERGQIMENIGSKTNIQIRDISVERQILFEQKFEISSDKSLFRHAPNIDVLIGNEYAIESKFSEPYSGKHQGLKTKYIENTSFWEGLPNLYELAKEISPDNNKFRYLDAAQLIKHVLGLRKKKYFSEVKIQRNHQTLTITPQTPTLVYLWYDVLGEDGFKHREEIEQFAKIVEKDGIHFRNITYQEVIANLTKDFYAGNEAYCDYLTERYL